MCTVTFIPDNQWGKSFILTDNRDESVNRPALAPTVHQEYGTRLYYPKDKRAGGTWFGVGAEKHVLTLMNGAFKPHDRKEKYEESRGVVVKKIVAAGSLKRAFMEYDLEHIEAFFAVGVSWREELRVYEMIWDGKQRFLRERDPQEPAIWSSAMLYSKDEKEKKENRFQQFLEQYHRVSKDNIWQLHHTSGSSSALGFIIDRGILQTTSVSQFSLQKGKILSFRYEDLISGYKQEEKVEWN